MVRRLILISVAIEKKATTLTMIMHVRYRPKTSIVMTLTNPTARQRFHRYLASKDWRKLVSAMMDEVDKTFDFLADSADSAVDVFLNGEQIDTARIKP